MGYRIFCAGGRYAADLPKPKRKPSLTKAARLAKKEGVEVKVATDGTVTVTPVKPLDITPTDTTETGNEWDTVQ